MDLLEQINKLAAYLDEEVKKIDNVSRCILLSRNQGSDPANIVLDIRSEISELTLRADELISFADSQSSNFEGFIKSMQDMINEFDEKIDRIEKHAANYGYVAKARELSTEEDQQDQIDEPVEKQALNSNATAAPSPNILELGLVSKSTLQSMGFKLKDCYAAPDMEKHEHEPEQVAESLDDSSGSEYFPSILKKPGPRKLDISAINQSRVEISPGLFVKRPSSKTKHLAVQKSTKACPSTSVLQVSSSNDDQCNSPKMPTLATFDMSTVLGRVQKTEASMTASDSPELPDFQSDEARLLSTTKMSKKKIVDTPQESHGVPIIQPKLMNESPQMPQFKTEQVQLLLSGKKVKPELGNSYSCCSTSTLEPRSNFQFLSVQNFEKENDDNSPQMPILNTYEAKTCLSSKKKTPVKENGFQISRPMDEEIYSPEVPQLKTMNLASVLNSEATFL